MKIGIANGVLAAALVFAGGRAMEAWGPAPAQGASDSDGVRQWGPEACGPASVATVLAIYRRPWDRATLERECRTGPGGSPLASLRDALRRSGLSAEVRRATEPDGLRRWATPYLIRLGPHHCGVVLRERDGRLDVFDPGPGQVTPWTTPELYRTSGGAAIVPGESFGPASRVIAATDEKETDR